MMAIGTNISSQLIQLQKMMRLQSVRNLSRRGAFSFVLMVEDPSSSRFSATGGGAGGGNVELLSSAIVDWELG